MTGVKKKSFLEYLNDELFSQDWLELFEAYNDRNKYGFLIFGGFDQLLDEYYTDRESLKNALSQGVFDAIDRDAWLYVVDDCGRISTYTSTYDLVADLAGYQALADFAKENDLPYEFDITVLASEMMSDWHQHFDDFIEEHI